MKTSYSLLVKKFCSTVVLLLACGALWAQGNTPPPL